jgi:beta-glucosidase-like glycosyl hydrolase
MLARALAQGLKLAGMAACGKHFPGHGAVKADSHHAIPRDPRSLTRILQEDAAPYQWLGDQVIASVMPAHVIYSKVDTKPAGFSSKWIQDILRGKLRYDGVVFSDDLTMEAAAVAGDILARAQAALQAGCDMALVCNRPDLADELLARLSHESDPASLARIDRLMPTAQAPDWQALQQQPAYRKALEVTGTSSSTCSSTHAARAARSTCNGTQTHSRYRGGWVGRAHFCRCIAGKTTAKMLPSTAFAMYRHHREYAQWEIHIKMFQVVFMRIFNADIIFPGTNLLRCLNRHIAPQVCSGQAFW